MSSERQVYIGNIPYGYTERDLERIVGDIGQIRMIKFFEDRGFAFIEMATREQAQALIDFVKEMAPVLSYGIDVHGDYIERELKVGWPKRKKMKRPHRRHQIPSKGQAVKAARWRARKEAEMEVFRGKPF